MRGEGGTRRRKERRALSVQNEDPTPQDGLEKKIPIARGARVVHLQSFPSRSINFSIYCSSERRACQNPGVKVARAKRSAAVRLRIHCRKPTVSDPKVAVSDQ